VESNDEERDGGEVRIVTWFALLTIFRFRDVARVVPANGAWPYLMHQAVAMHLPGTVPRQGLQARGCLPLLTSIRAC
jgi:hypothetical protein